ncbi:putative adhesin [Synechococcus sp. PCC 7336]|uniref:putative adhesin n=1 Tax=Synechococcus sp. PCC 7336 TaxID=195250 RepID=UPI0012EA964A|nr:hypothetical protein [Synechococcus sp. PCC 7336]
MGTNLSEFIFGTDFATGRVLTTEERTSAGASAAVEGLAEIITAGAAPDNIFRSFPDGPRTSTLGQTRNAGDLLPNALRGRGDVDGLLDAISSPNDNVTRGVFGPNAGRNGAREVLPGGNGQAVAGHGAFVFGSGDAIIPSGTTLVVPRENIRISDTTGRVLESIDLERLVSAGPRARSRLIRQQLDNLGVTNRSARNRVLQDLRDLQVFRPGDAAPNFTAAPPDFKLTVFEESTTVNTETLLSDILQENGGACALATCTEFILR